MPFNESGLSRAVDSALLVRLSRMAILFVTVVCVPAAGYGLKRIMERVDDTGIVTSTTAQKLELLTQSVQLTFQQRQLDVARIEMDLRDKETRLRVLEHAAQDHYGTLPLRGRSPN